MSFGGGQRSMDMALPGDGGNGPPSFLGSRLESAFELRVVAVAPGCSRAYHAEEWRDALVVVEHGEIELERSAGGRHRVSCGDVLWLDGLPLLALHNRGREPAVLVAVSRRAVGTEAPRPGPGGHPHDR